MDEKEEQEFLDQVDKKVNRTIMACGHFPCNLGGCKNCKEHCYSRN